MTGSEPKRLLQAEPKTEEKQPERGPEWFLGNVKDCVEFLTACWTFLMLTVFPVYVIDHYQDIGAYKFSFFSGISTLFLVPGTVLGIVYAVGKLLCSRKDGQPEDVRTDGQPNGGRGSAKRTAGVWKAMRAQFSWLDAGVLAYLLCNLLSFLGSGFREDAWAGADGWNMGLRTQLLMGAAYFLLSRFFPLRRQKLILAGAMLGSGIAFLIGVLHRFSIDPLGFYQGLDGDTTLRFLSTIGQATWYSSFVCTVLPIGLCLFYASHRTKVRLVSGVYCALGFMTLVTQNSDSAFAALAAMLFGLFLSSCISPKRMERFLEVVILCAVSFKAVGLLQQAFPAQAVKLGSLSEAFSKGAISWIMLLAGAAFYILLLHLEEKRGSSLNKRGEFPGKSWEKTGRLLFRLACILAGGLIIAAIGAIVLNTTGLLGKWFGIFSDNQYLLFNDKWGSNRGFNWKMAVRIFAGLPFLHKIFGVGPDCFMAYSYSVPEYAQRLNDYWKPDVLTNAHNEFLNLLICIGAVGLLSFLFLLGAGARRFYRIGKEHPEVLMGLLAICSYSAHNFFCYQQVCCTPFLFLILGLSECLVRRAEERKRENRQEIPG
ncbi:MAG TPA: O-antigen ligase family protein [Candidatus Eisenbergiella merdipullorum]|uniref:O-antigen ligase family protein n=1 Tax=Candidatus Eisenbergiella merdipullorum TaxID=2838553 RepID=A0A9D2I3G9_9FIRM|nr:O-antigen ligase family protein [Candidatus Eisenbergiella merdipullorum]